MNKSKQVVQLVVGCFLCLFLISIFIHTQSVKSKYLNNISILSDVIPNSDSLHKSQNDRVINSPDSLKIEGTGNNGIVQDKAFFKFNIPNRVTNFSKDTNSIVLKGLIRKLKLLKQTKKGKIRIAFLGDSMIEGDLVSQTFRNLLQKEFGGRGVGFVPITSPIAGFRNTVKHSFSNKWMESNFRTKISSYSLFLSGKVFFANGYNWAEFDDKTLPYPIPSTKKYLLSGYKPLTGQIAFNRVYNSLNSKNNLNKILIDSLPSSKVKIETADANLPLYGVSFETEDGVVVDNFSFRGNSGFEFSTIDTAFLHQISNIQQYDLIILQYGVNVLNKPNNNSFYWYYKSMLTCINKLKIGFKGSEFLLLSAADKSFKYKDGYKTAIGMDSLIATQQHIAFDAGISFYNTYQSMGGYNSMINWVTQSNLAAKDFTHLNFKGAELLGTSIFKSLMYEYNKE